MHCYTHSVAPHPHNGPIEYNHKARNSAVSICTRNAGVINELLCYRHYTVIRNETLFASLVACR